MEIFLLLADKKQIALTYIVTNDTPSSLVGDQVKLRQVLLNLIGNALKFTEKGSITLTISGELISDDNCLLAIQIKDTGIGISTENQQHLFQPFNQADNTITREFGGTGLGLSICKQIIDIMEGTIQLESCLGKGTTFKIKIPFSIDDTNKKEQLFSESTFAGKRVLIMTTVEKHRNVLSNRCEYWGLEITLIEEPEQAISLLSETDIDWLIVEPENINFELLYLYFLQSKHKPTIIFIGHTEQQTKIQQCWNDLDYQFVAHPVFLTKLQEALCQKKINKQSTQGDKLIEISSAICVTDDNAVNRTILQKILKKQGCTNILIAKDGIEAVEICKSQDVELMFMDLQMPNLDGIGATKEIFGQQSAKYNLPTIIALTANVTAEDKEKCESAGMQDFLTKPIRIEHIQHVLKKYVLNKT